MMELPEAATLARQLKTVLGRTVAGVETANSPHKFAFFNGDAADYDAPLKGRPLDGTDYMGGFVRLGFEDKMLLLGDGVGLRLIAPGEALPKKYQLLVRLDDGAALACLVQMYGGMWLDDRESCENPYYQTAREKPDPLGDGFTPAYFDALAAGAKKTLSAKAFLATEQRIPGLGNGMLQDILFHARVNPKTKLEQLADSDLEALYQSTTGLLRTAAEKGGRDTEKDLYGQPGGYVTTLNAKTAKAPCPVCDGPITKQAYLGGSVYFCPVCQPLV